MSAATESNFHAGETALQARIGVDGPMAKLSRLAIYDAMPDQHREFYAQLPFAVVAMADRQGFPIPTLVSGNPGFMSTPDDKTLVIEDRPLLASALDIGLAVPSRIGFLGIELHTRRRNRMNGVFRIEGDDRLIIDVDQSFGNCPQYIQLRSVDLREDLDPEAIDEDGAVSVDSAISPAQRAVIEKADTFYIGSRTPVFDADSRNGIDVSHRGGKPGFVRIDDDGNLWFPDFSGNRFFNTLGNIALDHRVGLLFLDYEAQDLIFISGRASVHWSAEQTQQVEGAERIVEIKPEKITHARGLLPFQAEFHGYSPVLERTGVWRSD